MEKEKLLERYETTGDEDVFVDAKRLYEKALAEGEDAPLLVGYGGLLLRHANFALRRALVQFENAIELDPGLDIAHYQLIATRAMLLEPERAIELYRKRLAAAAGDIREYRFLATACLQCHEYAEASAVIEAGLELVPDDPILIECRGSVRAGTGDPDGALAEWRRALELNPENLSPAYSTAFLLERDGRLQEAVETWRYIIEWCEARDYRRDIEWPRQEIGRLRDQLPPASASPPA